MTRGRAVRQAAVVLAALSAFVLSGQLAVDHVVVKPGDTLSKIAAEYRVSVPTLATHNSIANPDLIFAGQVLSIPSAFETRHTVQLGDTVSRIAARYDSSIAAIIERNSLTNPDLVLVGQVLVVPRVAPATGPTATSPSPRPTTPTTPTTSPVVPAPPSSVAATTTTVAPPTTTIAIVASAIAPPVAPTTTTLARPSGAGLVSTMWTVQNGDTVASIAARFGLAPRRLASANAISEADPLLVGQRLYIPAS